jgi:hypothetical protein
MSEPFAYVRADLDDEPEPEAADFVRQWELADQRDRWKHTGERPPPAEVRNSDTAWPIKTPYRTPQATVDAFWYVVRLNDHRYLLWWLEQHPKDAAHLEKLLEEKCQTKRS